jgi:hypothetical protein
MMVTIRVADFGLTTQHCPKGEASFSTPQATKFLSQKAVHCTALEGRHMASFALAGSAGENVEQVDGRLLGCR